MFYNLKILYLLTRIHCLVAYWMQKKAGLKYSKSGPKEEAKLNQRGKKIKILNRRDI